MLRNRRNSELSTNENAVTEFDLVPTIPNSPAVRLFVSQLCSIQTAAGSKCLTMYEYLTDVNLAGVQVSRATLYRWVHQSDRNDNQLIAFESHGAKATLTPEQIMVMVGCVVHHNSMTGKVSYKSIHGLLRKHSMFTLLFALFEINAMPISCSQSARCSRSYFH